LNKKNITQELLKIEEGGASDFARGNNCKGWKGGYREIFFSKSKSIKHHKDYPLMILFYFFEKLPNVKF
jgi:hypothetical protein